MNETICGAKCEECEMKENCGGCTKTKGQPFGKECIIAKCCKEKNQKECNSCNAKCNLKEKIIEELKELKIEEMQELTDLNALKGSYVNIEYELPNGQNIKLLEDDKIYLGNQICKKSKDRCYGIVADENHLLVCEYGINGENAEIITYKKR